MPPRHTRNASKSNNHIHKQQQNQFTRIPPIVVPPPPVRQAEVPQSPAREQQLPLVDFSEPTIEPQLIRRTVVIEADSSSSEGDNIMEAGSGITLAATVRSGSSNSASSPSSAEPSRSTSPISSDVPIVPVSAKEREPIAADAEQDGFQADSAPGDGFLGKLVDEDEPQIDRHEVLGHSREPILSRDQTFFDSLSRTIRTFKPKGSISMSPPHVTLGNNSPRATRSPSSTGSFAFSHQQRGSNTSIPLTSPLPSPPLVSRPVSFGQFAGHQGVIEADGGDVKTSNEQPRHGPGKRRGSEAGNTARDNNDLNSHTHAAFVHKRDGPTPARRNVLDVFTPSGGIAASANVRALPSPVIVEDVQDATLRDETGKDPIMWARWDLLRNRRLIIIGYGAGLQIWDCTLLAHAEEILNLRATPGDATTAAQTKPISYAGVIPCETDSLVGLVCTDSLMVYSLVQHIVVKQVAFPEGEVVNFACGRDGIVVSTSSPPALHVLHPTTFVVTHVIPAQQLLANPTLTLTTTTDSNLNIINNSNLNNDVYHNATNNQHTSNNNVSLDSDPSHIYPGPTSRFLTERTRHEPVYALSGRLLAYASTAPRPSNTSRSSMPTTHTLSDVDPATTYSSKHTSPHNSNPIASSSSTPAAAFTSASVSNAALKAGMKLGGSVFSGMRSLGGMAINAAFENSGNSNNTIPNTAINTGGSPESTAPTGVLAGSVGRFFSRSAPAASSGASSRGETFRGRTASFVSAVSGAANLASSLAFDGAQQKQKEGGGYWVTVVDLAPSHGSFLDLDTTKDGHHRKPSLASSSSSSTAALIDRYPIVSQFKVSQDQPVSMLAFSANGTAVLVSTKDGQIAKVFQVRPGGIVDSPGIHSKSLVGDDRVSGGGDDNSDTHHVYDLRRGRTSATIESVDWAGDGRWIALGTRKRTVHVFAVNAYGGKPDVKSHLDGAVKNCGMLQPLSTEVSPLVRLRVQRMPTLDDPKVPLVFQFLSASEAEASLPPSLLPPMTTVVASSVSPPSSTSTSYDRHRYPEPTSPGHYHRQTNVQHMLIFDPTDGMISLRRFTIDVKRGRAAEHSLGSNSISSHLPSALSASLPVSGLASRFGASPPVSGLTRMMEPLPEELTASRESVLATWPLRRQREWGEVRRVVGIHPHHFDDEQSDGVDWLARAELSTCSSSVQVLPRSIYLSHQFSFHTLGEDYHALIRQFQLGVVGSKIVVRTQVEVSGANTTSGFGSTSETFGGDLPSSPTHGSSRRNFASSASFDEPLASAIAGGLDYNLPPPVLPMLPNGSPSTGAISFPPLRGTMTGLGEGMSESFGRIRRDMHHRVLSPRLNARPDNSMPLVFDEEDEKDEFLDCRQDVFGDDDDGMVDGMDMGIPAPTESVPTPVASSAVPVAITTRVAEEDIFDGWGGDSEDRRVIEDQEQFHHVAAVGSMDEDVDIAPALAPAQPPKARKATRRKDRKRGGM